MSNNEGMLNGLSSLSDEKLKELIEDIGAAVGVNAKKTEALTGNLSGVRKTIGGMSEAEAKRLIESAGRDKANQIYEAIQRSRH